MAQGTFRRRILAVAVLGVVAAGVQPAVADTGQGIMVNLMAPSDILLVQNQIFSFDAVAAKALFTNVWDGMAPIVTCTGGGCPGTAPAAPGAPAPDATKVSQQLVQGNKCNFWNGTDIAGTTYTQKAAAITVGSGSSKATYNYTYTYVVSAPTQPAQTAWNLTNVSGDGTSADVLVGADIAGESVLSSRQHPRKYSFSLDYTYTDPVTLLPVMGNRVSDLVVSLDQGTASEISQAATSTLLFPIDFSYQTNAGSNGNTSLLSDGDARTILNTDSFAGNDNGGSDGKALALAQMDAVTFTVPVGDHAITLTGTVKDNTATYSTGFSVSQAVHVIAESCTAPVGP